MQANLFDRQTELALLSGLLHEPDETVAGLQRLKFERSALYFDVNQKFYDAICYVCNGCYTDGMLVNVYNEVKSRVPMFGWLGNNFGSSREFVSFLVDVWETNWFEEVRRWANTDIPDTGFHAWLALAAAARVVHLQSRRHAKYAAEELLRSAIDPTVDAEDFENWIDKLEEL